MDLSKNVVIENNSANNSTFSEDEEKETNIYDAQENHNYGNQSPQHFFHEIISGSHS